MKLVELQQILRAADPAAVLVSPRVLERVIQEICKLPNLFWTVPHRQSYVVDRQILFRHVDQEELDLESDQLLPPTVILLSRPPSEDLGAADREALLLKYWQRLFHAKIHFSLEGRYADGRLTLADIRDRIEQIGQVEFEEIRSVLVQDQYLQPQADERKVYIEFAAVFLDLRHFAPDLLPTYFPGLRDLERIERILALDVDDAALFQQTRLAGAPDPTIRREIDRPDEAQEFYWRLVHASERAARQGNMVRAAILRMRAARVAPGALSYGTRAEAVQFLQRLMSRLQTALQLSDAEAAEWMKDLPALLDKADQGTHPVEAALLFDLQKTCLDFERDIYALDLVEWALSAGRKPIKRPLPGQRSVLVIKHLRDAAQRLTMARLSDADRQHFAGLFQSALQQCEERLRARFRPVLATAMHDVGMQPENPPERTAFNKIIEEMLDRIVEHGYLIYSDLRDTLSRNQLKLHDLPDPQEFIRGDPLLRLDRRLGALLDGVYRPSEIYMRLLERVTALSFGTYTGRLLMRFVVLPFGGAWMLVEMVIAVLGFFVAGLPTPEIPSTPMAAAALTGQMALGGWGAPAAAAQRVLHPHYRPPEYVYFPTWALLGVFLLALIHHRRFRRRCTRTLLRLGRAARALFFDWPLKVIQIPALKRIVISWSFQLLYWYILKPFVVCLLLWFWWPEPFNTWFATIFIFLGVHFLLNSQLGHAVSEALNQAMYRFFDLLRTGLIPGLIHLVTRVFKQITDQVEYFLFTVDEWLWFRSGESRTALVTRTILGVFWYPIGYLARFVMVVLIEPGYNPLKAPVSYLAAKFMAPITLLFWAWLPVALASWPTPLRVPAVLVGWLIIFHLPDVFGFLFWEMKESWSLYRANRPAAMKPVPVGSHGETVRRLLRPGFHSGTVPKLFARLRSAERRARVTGNWRRSRTCRRALHEVQEATRQFVTRELVFLVNQSTSWQGQGLAVGRVTLGSNRISVELAHGAHPDRAVWLEFEECAGWLVAGIRDPGWLAQLTEEQLQALNTALATLYKLAGVDLVREQLRVHLPPQAASYDIRRTGLAVWLDRRHGNAILYDLQDAEGPRTPTTPDGKPTLDWPVIDARRLVFASLPLSWEQLVANWRKDQEAQGQPPLVSRGVELDLLGPSLPPRSPPLSALA